MKRLTTLAVIMAFVGLTTAVSPVPEAAAAARLFVIPSAVNFGVIDASDNPAREIPLVVALFPLPSGGREIPSPLSISLRQPLTNQATGRALPPSRLYIGFHPSEQPFPDETGAIQLPLPANRGLVVLAFGIHLLPFDPPGEYEGKLGFVDPGDGSIVEVPIELDIRQWVKIERLLDESVLTAPPEEEPGPDGYVYSGEAVMVKIMSNGSWRLTARLESDFIPRSGPGDLPIPATELFVRVVETDWVIPNAEGFVRLATSPVILATGGPTGEYGDGWVPVSLEARLPYDRNHAAGAYASHLEFGVDGLEQQHCP